MLPSTSDVPAATGAARRPGSVRPGLGPHPVPPPMARPPRAAPVTVGSPPVGRTAGLGRARAGAPDRLLGLAAPALGTDARALRYQGPGCRILRRALEHAGRRSSDRAGDPPPVRGHDHCGAYGHRYHPACSRAESSGRPVTLRVAAMPGAPLDETRRAPVPPYDDRHHQGKWRWIGPGAVRPVRRVASRRMPASGENGRPKSPPFTDRSPRSPSGSDDRCRSRRGRRCGSRRHRVR